MAKTRIVDGRETPDDVVLEQNLRPARLADFIGQEQLKRRLGIAIEAARLRGKPLDHVIVSGPPGLGKTTLAHIIATEMGTGLKTTSGPVLERKDELAALLTADDVAPGTVIFIDEIHRLPRVVEECLYPAMEDFFIDVTIDSGLHARSIKLDLPPFTLVGATTRSAQLTGPLRDRFGIQLRVEFYEEDDLHAIVLRSARVLGIQVADDGAREIARRSRRTPRVANRLLNRVHDYALVEADGVITRDVADAALRLYDIDACGLDALDRQILHVIADHFDGGPVGLKTLAISVGEDADTVEDVYEPFLIQTGMINRTPKGRVITSKGYEHIHRKPPLRSPGLF